MIVAADEIDMGAHKFDVRRLVIGDRRIYR
jgi:hypothetical protein